MVKKNTIDIEYRFLLLQYNKYILFLCNLYIYISINNN